MTFTATRYLGNYYYYFTADYINWTVMVSRYWLSCLDINLVRCFSMKSRKINVFVCVNAIPGDRGQGSQIVFVCAGQTISCLETTRQFPQMARKDNLKTSWTVSTERKRLCLELHACMLILLFLQNVLGRNYRRLCDWRSRCQIWPLIEFYYFDETLDIRALSVQNSSASWEAVRSRLVIHRPNSDHNEDI